MELRYNYVLINVNQPALLQNVMSRLDDCVKRYIDYRNECEVRSRNYHLIWVRAQTFYRMCLKELEQ